MLGHLLHYLCKAKIPNGTQALLEFLRGINSVTHALTVSIYSYNQTYQIVLFISSSHRSLPALRATYEHKIFRGLFCWLDAFHVLVVSLGINWDWYFGRMHSTQHRLHFKDMIFFYFKMFEKPCLELSCA